MTDDDLDRAADDTVRNLSNDELRALIAGGQLALEAAKVQHPPPTALEFRAAIEAVLKSRHTGQVTLHRQLVLKGRENPQNYLASLDAIDEAARVLVAVMEEHAPGATDVQIATWLREHTVGELRDQVQEGLVERARIAHQVRANAAGTPGEHAEGASEDPDEDDAPRGDDRPQIKITTELHEVINASEAALAAKGNVYSRGGRLVTVRRGLPSDDPETWARSPHGTMQVLEYTVPMTVEALGFAARYLKYDRQEGAWVPSRAPKDVAEVLLARRLWPRLPYLGGIVSAPALRHDGTLLDQPGYDAGTRLVYEPEGVAYPAIPASPTYDDARRAYAELVEPFSEFPFVEANHLAAVVALLLTVLARSAIRGPTPVFGVEATSGPGTGKGLVIDVVALIATGQETSKTQHTDDVDEQRKAMLSFALSAPPIINIDNVVGEFGSPVLASIATSGNVSGRLLGSNTIADLHVRSVLAYSGNGVKLTSDLSRRTLEIRLDAKCERPEMRTFKRNDVKAYVTAERPRLVAAALTLLRAYVVAGRPSHGQAKLGSYESWDDLIRGAVVWAGGVDPDDVERRRRGDTNEEDQDLVVLMRTWLEVFGDQPTTLADALDRRIASRPLNLALNAYGSPHELDARKLGYVMRSVRGRVRGGMRFERAVGHEDVKRWYVARDEPATTAP